MNNMWSDYRNRVLEQNVKVLMSFTFNINLCCCEFYEKIKSNKDFLKKVLFTEKYDGRMCKFINA